MAPVLGVALVFELVPERVLRSALQLATPKSQIVQSAIYVVEGFSCRLPQFSSGPIAESVFAFDGSQHGRA
jgi:hypothetical protein